MDLIYQQLMQSWNGGKMYSVNGKESAMEQWQKLTPQEKMKLVIDLANREDLPLEALVNESTRDALEDIMLKSSDTISTIQYECNQCGKSLSPTKVTQFDIAGGESRVTPDSLPRIICSGCEV